jgi:Fur family transcriptional regulator, ferric uptake regulator
MIRSRACCEEWIDQAVRERRDLKESPCMTVSHCAEPLPLPTPLAALGTLRARGLRISETRRLIVEALFTAEGPVSADALARSVGADVASVYRNLDALEAAGIARHVHVGHAAGRYVRVGDAATEYVACERCGRFEAIEPARLDGIRDLLERELGYEIRFSHFPAVGTCPSCRSTPAMEDHHAHS